LLVILDAALAGGFAALRIANLYGDAAAATVQPSTVLTVNSFSNRSSDGIPDWLFLRPPAHTRRFEMERFTGAAK
jgi:hypothetical protein